MDEIIAVNKALSDGNRVRVLAVLQDGELCACNVIDLLGLAQSTVSKHMGLLVNAGLVKVRKDGRWMHYRLPQKKECSSYIYSIINLTVKQLGDNEQTIKDRKQVSSICCQG
ncbi:MAG: ArsR/SmtB family transcription factor [Planctomycetota bacterium]|jgi:ArsR family transcriptional regulator